MNNPPPNGRRSPAWRRIIGCIAVSAALLNGIEAEPNAQAHSSKATLADASLEELMNIEVRSVGRKEQKLAAAAAAVYVVTQDDIRRSGATNVPEVLRMVPGVQVARLDSSKWAVSARGFNGRFANKMLVLIDGRSIYTNLYSGVYWDQNDVLLEDIDRIEVIRGPGATMWGANAVNGVINIITKKAADTQGGLLAVGSGTEENGSFVTRYGGKAGDKVHYRAFGKAYNRNHLLARGGQADANDGWNQRRGGGRVDWQATDRDAFTFHGDLYAGKSHQSRFANFPLLNGGTIVDSVDSNGGYALGRWEHTISEKADAAVQLYYNREDRREPIGDGHFQTIDLDVQQHYAASGRHDLVFGGGYRRIQDQIGGPVKLFIPESRTDHMASVFVQDDFSIVPNALVVSAGTKLLTNSYSGFEVQPGVRLLWMPTKKQSVWSAVSRAVRTPSRRDTDVVIRFDLSEAAGPMPAIKGVYSGNPDFRSEALLAYEAGYRNQIHHLVAVDLATFYNRYRNLESRGLGQYYVDPGPPAHLVIPITSSNDNEGRTYGAELATTWTLAPRWRVNANYSYLHLDLHPIAGIKPLDVSASIANAFAMTDNPFGGTSPKHAIQFRSTLNLTSTFTLDTAVYYISALKGINIPAHTRFDCRLGWQLSKGNELSIGANDLFKASHPEFVSEDYVSGSDARRGAYVKLSWRF